ncbi:MAG: hypothetical protein Q9222_003797 [Ikaeria aurantiellina]
MYKDAFGLTGRNSNYKADQAAYKFVGGMPVGIKPSAPKPARESKSGSSMERLASKISGKVSGTKTPFCKEDVKSDCHPVKHPELDFLYCKAHKSICAIRFGCPETPLKGHGCPKHDPDEEKEDDRVKLRDQVRQYRKDDYDYFASHRQIKFAEGTKPPIVKR